MRLGGIYLDVGARTTTLKRDLAKAKGLTKKAAVLMNQQLGKINFRHVAMAATVAFASVTYAMKKSIDAAIEQEAVEKRLGAVLESTGHAAGFNLDQMKLLAREMQEVTTIGDEMVLSGMAILGTFKQIRGEGFERATMAAADLSEVMQQDLKTSVVMIGKALNDPIANLSAMTRAGVQFSDQQKKMIKTLWESGEAAKAQGVILDELEAQFGGAAAAARDQFGGAVKSAKNAFGDLTEEIGFGITKSDEMIDIAKRAEQQFITWGKSIKENREKIAEFAGQIVLLAGAIGGVIKKSAAFGSVWVKTWQALGLAAAGQMTYTEALLVGAIRVDEFNEKIKKQNELLKKNKETKENLAVLGGTGGTVLSEKEIEAAQELADAKRDIREQSQWSVYASQEEALAQYIEFSNAEIAEEQRKADLKKQIQKDAAMSAISNAAYAFKLLGQHSKTAFGVFKAFAIAETLIDTYRAAQGAYAALAKINPALGIAAAAAATASGLARVQQIKSMTPGGGGGGGAGGGGGGGTYPVDPATGLPPIDTGASESRGTVTINIQGDFIGDESYIDMLVERINEAEDRDVYINQSNYAVETL